MTLAALLALTGIIACQSSAPNPPSLSIETPVPVITSQVPQSPVLLTYRSQTSIAAPVWLPDNTHLAFVSGGGTNSNESVDVFNVLTKQLTKTVTLPSLSTNTPGGWSWSPDGSSIVFASADGKLTIWDTLTGRKLLDYNSDIPSFPLYTWAPDSQRIALASQVDTSQVMQVWNVVTGHELLTFFVPTHNIYDVEWSPDGEHIAILTSDKTFQLWDSTTGQTIQRFTDPDLSIILWSPDGKRILSSLTIKRTTDTSLSIWDVLTGRKLLTYSGHTSPAIAAQWSSDGQRILSMSMAEILLWNTSTGQTILRMPIHTPTYLDIAELSPDGRYLAYSRRDNLVQMWNAVTGRELLINASHAASVQSIVWSPDSKRIASADANGFVNIWDAATGKAIYTYHVSSARIQNLSWSLNSQLLVVTAQDNLLEILRG